MRTHRNPKGPHFTPEQEAEYERYEVTLARARILELGVSAVLNASNGTYLSSIEIAEASRTLADAVALRRDAVEGREQMRKRATLADELASAKRKSKGTKARVATKQ